MLVGGKPPRDLGSGSLAISRRTASTTCMSRLARYSFARVTQQVLVGLLTRCVMPRVLIHNQEWAELAGPKRG